MTLRVAAAAALFVSACTMLPATPPVTEAEAEVQASDAVDTSVGSASPQATAGDEGPTASTDGGADGAEHCVVFCYGVQVSSAQATVDDAESYTVAQTENANAVLARLNDDLVACYRARARIAPRAEDEIVFEIVIGEGGRVRSVGSTGGDRLGSAKGCMVDVLRGAQFAAPHGGGTVTIKAPFKLRVQGDDGV